MWRELEPRASRLWIRYAPRRWPGVDRPCLDLAERRMQWPGQPSKSSVSAFPAPVTMADVVLMPALEKAHTREGSELAAALVANGSAILEQRFAGAVDEGSAGKIVVDLTEALLAADPPSLGPMPVGAVAVLPLLPAASDAESGWSSLLSHLRTSGLATVVGVAPELSPVDRRRLVERLGEESFERVHHAGGSAGDLERHFARSVVAAGMSPFFERPAVPGLPPRAERNRRIAAALFEAGERWLALGRGEADAAALVAAARHVDAAPQEIEALARERQLALLPWLSPLARRAVESFVESGKSALLAELRAEWLGVEVTA